MIGDKAALQIADVTKPDEVQRLVDATVKKFGRIDFLVNNAAVRYETAFADMSYDEWRSVLSIVLDGAFLCAKAVMPHLVKAGGGTIVNIGGQTGHKGAAERAHVITAKAGLAGMTKALAMDLAPHKITVNCVVPGTIDSQRGLPGVPDRPAHRMTVPPIGRRGEPEEIAAMVRMLCGPDARYITGQSIHLNGGGFMP
jgi:3-oxoacyl-[acyl-carrier protein] reductase